MVSVHEIWHLYKFEKGEVNGAQTNAEHHQSMIDNPDYKNMIKDLFPDKSDEFHNNARYAGTIGTPVFDNLSKENQKELMDFF